MKKRVKIDSDDDSCEDENFRMCMDEMQVYHSIITTYKESEIMDLSISQIEKIIDKHIKILDLWEDMDKKKLIKILLWLNNGISEKNTKI